MLVKVAGSTLNQIPIDWEGNKKRILKAIETARQENVSILCLPELSITGYGCEDIFFSPDVHKRSLNVLMDLVRETKNLVVVFGLPLNVQGQLFNSAAVAADGELLGFVPKKFLAGEGVHYEPRWFKTWPTEVVQSIEVDNTTYPVGDIHFKFEDLKIGLEICEEAWAKQRHGLNLAKKGVDIILNPSASHFAFGKIKSRQRLACEASQNFHVGYVYTNLLGNETGRTIFDGGVIIADRGQIISQGERFSYKDCGLTVGVIDINHNRALRSQSRAQDLKSLKKDESCVESKFKIPSTISNTNNLNIQTWENSQHIKSEEFSRAVALGLFDFVRKSHQNGFVISLSGGVDSAAVTLLCRLTLDFAFQEIGLEGIKSRLSHIPFVVKAKNLEEISKQMITCAYQGTQNSSRATLEAARAIANEVGASFHEWTIDDVLSDYIQTSEEVLQEKMTWEKHDVSLQNIQARARGPAIWVLANVKQALLLATSNRSEAAVGYATMDGDTCGSISPIGGIDKNFLRLWAQWMKEFGPENIKAFKSFEKVLSQPPTAELRPPSHKQTDEDDLMPYDVLDAIEELAIRDKKTPLECFLILSKSQSDLAKLKSWIIKFFKLWCRNQWKRERYAPSFHLDDVSLDPKTWCRFPIIMSGYADEIKELEDYKI